MNFIIDDFENDDFESDKKHLINFTRSNGLSYDFSGHIESLDSNMAPNGDVSKSQPSSPLFFYGITNNSLISSIESDIAEGMAPYAITFTYPDISTSWNKICYSEKTNRQINRKMTTNIEDMPYDFQIDKLQKDILSWCRDLDKFLPKYSAIKQIAVYFEKTKIGRIHGHGIITMNNNYNVAVSQAMSMLWVKRSKGSFKSLHKNKGKYTDNAFDKCNDVKKWIAYISKENPDFQFPIDRVNFTQYVKAQKSKVSEYINDSELLNDKYASQENIEENKKYYFFPKNTIIDENQLSLLASKSDMMKTKLLHRQYTTKSYKDYGEKISINFD